MKKIFIFFLFIFIFSYLSAQDWTEPINISNTPGLDYDPSFCIDNNGVLHCVWSYKIGQNFRKLYYSKSEDEGESWSTPQDISQNSQYWCGQPHIVADSENNLYVTYDYNIGDYYHTQVHLRKFDGTTWSEPTNLTENYPGSDHNRIVIDNNDRVYVFWFWGAAGYGEFYYRYLENGEWGSVICPYNDNDILYFLQKAVSDNENNLHCTGVYHLGQSGYDDRTNYFHYDYQTDTWSDLIVLGTDTCWQGLDIDLDNNEYPHIVWRQYVNDSIPPNDGTLYSCFDGENWTEPEILVEDPWWQVIAIDNNDIIHLVEKEKYDTGSGIFYNLVYYTNIDSILEGTIIVESENVASLPKLEIFNNKLYLIYFNSNEPSESDIYFTKKDLSIHSIEEHYINNISVIYLSQNYPNPFNPTTQIDFSLNKGGYTALTIFNIKGQLIKKLVDEYKKRGDYSILWNGKNKDGKEVSSGIYLYRLQIENHCVTRSLNLVK